MRRSTSNEIATSTVARAIYGSPRSTASFGTRAAGVRLQSPLPARTRSRRSAASGDRSRSSATMKGRARGRTEPHHVDRPARSHGAARRETDRPAKQPAHGASTTGCRSHAGPAFGVPERPNAAPRHCDQVSQPCSPTGSRTSQAHHPDPCFRAHAGTASVLMPCSGWSHVTYGPPSGPVRRLPRKSAHHTRCGTRRRWRCCSTELISA